MVKNILFKYGKFISIFVLAFFMSQILKTQIFVGTTPRLQANLDKKFQAQLKLLTNPRELIARLFPDKTKENEAVAYAEQKIKEGYLKLQKVAFTQIAPGVSVRATENVSETSYDINGVKWIKHTILVNGVERTFGWPEGKELPPMYVLEGMFP